MTAPLWTKDPVGTPVGMWCACRFFLSSTQRNTGRSTWISATRGGRTAVSDATLLRRRRLQGPARHHRAQPAHPPRRHDAPTHETHVVRTRRARASSPSGTRMRGRTYSSTSQLRQGIPTVFTVRTCAQRSSSPTSPATAYGHFHISNIYGYASPHGGATVRVSH
jgi:hypothetical protein